MPRVRDRGDVDVFNRGLGDGGQVQVGDHRPSERLQVHTAYQPIKVDTLRDRKLAFAALEAYELLVERGKVELRPEQIDVLIERNGGLPRRARPRRDLAAGSRRPVQRRVEVPQ